jgi:ketosteroid isomerase-like protein
MKPRILTPWLCFLIGVCALLVPATRSYSGEITGEAKILAKLDDAWSASAGQRDLNKLVSFYAADAVAYPPGAGMAHGTAEIRKVWEGITDPNYALSWVSTQAAVAASGDIGFTSGTFQESTTGSDGKVTKATGKFLCVWRKQQDGGWKAIHDMWNYDK